MRSTVRDGWQQYAFGPGWRVTQLWPAACKNGHPFTPSSGTVGWSPPDAISYTCNQCWDDQRGDAVTYWRPRPTEWLLARSLAQAIADGLTSPDFRLPRFPHVHPQPAVVDGVELGRFDPAVDVDGG